MYKKIIGLVISALILTIYYVSLNSLERPQFPPPRITDPDAEYVLRKYQDTYYIEYHKLGKFSCCIAIGESIYSLDDYINQKVKVQGDYLRDGHGNIIVTEKQCINYVCHQINEPIDGQSVGSFAVQIDHIELAN